MSYLNQSRLAGDHHIIQRVTACAATENIPDPQFWVQQRMWQFSAQPGWASKYASALVTHETTPGSPSPGENEAAITDGDILAAVQALHTLEVTDGDE